MRKGLAIFLVSPCSVRSGRYWTSKTQQNPGKIADLPTAATTAATDLEGYLFTILVVDLTTVEQIDRMEQPLNLLEAIAIATRLSSSSRLAILLPNL